MSWYKNSGTVYRFKTKEEALSFARKHNGLVVSVREVVRRLEENGYRREEERKV